MKQLMYLISVLFFCMSAHGQELDLKAIEDLKASLKTINESELTPQEKEQKTKLAFSKATGSVETARSHYTQTYQFDKAKRAKEILAQLKEGKSDIETTPAKVETKKEEPKEEKSAKTTAAAPFLKEMFKEELKDKDGKTVNLNELNGKVIGVYFSASWCGPCRHFTPDLVKLRDENAANFEVVFVSCDHSESDKNKYMTDFKMKWPAVKINGKDYDTLNTKFHSDGIPYLVILSKSGNVITTDGRSEISSESIKKWSKEK